MQLSDPEIVALLDECVRLNASDVHLSSGAQPYFRVDGVIASNGGLEMSAQEVERIVHALLNPSQLRAFAKQHTVDLALSLEGGERFRIHLFRERGVLALAARRLDDSIRSLEQLHLPAALRSLAELRDGLVLFTGPTGSGKTTSLATLIHQINQSRACHILTIEDPIEYLHRNEKSLIRQRELHSDFRSFQEAVRSSVREDPDVVLVGEMRDVETMRAAIAVAETGHLVFSTLHCGNAVGAIDRLVGAFPGGERESLCQQLSMTLRAVVAQRLLPRLDTKGRVPAVEILKVTSGVANLVRKHKSQQIYSAMENGAGEEMQTLEQSLAELVAQGLVREGDARRVAQNPMIFEERLRRSERAVPSVGRGR